MTKHKLLIVISLAILVRLIILIAGRSLFFYEETGLIHGSTAYDEYALNLLETGIYGREVGIPDSNIPPLYSYVVAAIYKLFGRGGLQIGLVHTLMDALSILLVYEIARKLFTHRQLWGESIGEWVGTLAGLFYALYPYLIFQNLSLNDTALFILLMQSFIYLLILLREQAEFDRQTLRIALLAGIILGITTLSRALLPLFAMFAAVWFLFRLPLLETVKRLAPVAIVSVFVLIPWILRNYSVYEGFVPVALNMGDNLYQGANPMTVPLFEAGYDVQWSDPPANSIEGDVYRNNSILIQAGMDWLQAHPQELPYLLWTKFLVHWSIDIAPRKNPLDNQSFALDEQGRLLVVDNPDANKQDIETIALYSGGFFARVARPIHILYFGGLLLCAIAGQVLTRRNWREVSLLIFLQVSMTIMYMIFHPSTRYRVPTDPLLFTFSAYAILLLLDYLNRWDRPRTLS